jgi:putative transposase
MWLHLRRLGHDVACCTVERLMAKLGLTGLTRDRTPRTTIADDKVARPADLVDRNFVASAPNRLWDTSIAFIQRLIDEGVDASVGSVGDAYDTQGIIMAVDIGSLV